MKKAFFTFILLLAVAGCTTTQKGTTAGAVAGTAIGGIIGYQSGNTAEGAAIGAAVGGLGGYVASDKLASKNFCPVCGKHYDSSVVYCPNDGTELKQVNK